MQAILESETGDLDRLFDVTIDPDTDTFAGRAQQRISLGRSQTYQFQISPDEMSYRLVDADAAASFADSEEGWAEIVEYAAKKGSRSGKKLNCRPGNIQCGGTCQSGKRNCFAGMNPAQKKAAAAAAKKAKGAAPGAAGAAKTVPLNAKTRPAAIALTSSRFLALPAAGQSSAPDNKRNGAPLSNKELRRQILDRFGVSSMSELQKNGSFRMANNMQKVDLRTTENLKQVYRRHVGVLPDERFTSGPKSINGVDVTKYSRPWQVFGINPQDSKYDIPKGLRGQARKQAENDARDRREADVMAAYRALAKRYHPDVGGDREVFERLTVFKDSLTARFG